MKQLHAYQPKDVEEAIAPETILKRNTGKRNSRKFVPEKESKNFSRFSSPDKMYNFFSDNTILTTQYLSNEIHLVRSDSGYILAVWHNDKNVGSYSINDTKYKTLKSYLDADPFTPDY